MSRKPRRKHSPTFNLEGALAAIQGDKTLVEFSLLFDVHENQIPDGQKQALQRADTVSGCRKSILANNCAVKT